MKRITINFKTKPSKPFPFRQIIITPLKVITFAASVLIVAIVSAQVPSVPAMTHGRQVIIASPGHRFIHPGVLNNAQGLAYLRQKVNAGEQPWLWSYQKAGCIIFNCEMSFYTDSR